LTLTSAPFKSAQTGQDTVFVVTCEGLEWATPRLRLAGRRRPRPLRIDHRRRYVRLEWRDAVGDQPTGLAARQAEWQRKRSGGLRACGAAAGQNLLAERLPACGR